MSPPLPTPSISDLSITLVAAAAVAGISACGLGNYDAGGADGGPIPEGRVHPTGFGAPDQHGPELERQAQDCRACHGQDLEGGAAAPGCDGCHTPAEPKAWRSDCTFCHGGSENDTGAPPDHLIGPGDAAKAFPHTPHVSEGLAGAFDCTECHVKTKDVLGPGHAFDDTPGSVEVDLGAGLSPQGAYTPNSGCSTLYCHGDGRGDTGAVAVTAGPMQCASCHPGPDSGAAAWSEMSGLHALHLGEGDIDCGDCHADVTADGATIAAPELHVDGRREVDVAEPGLTFDPAGQACAGTCHGESHDDYTWEGGGEVHPDGFAQPSAHGVEMELGRQDCRNCHGQDLRGSGAAPSCDSCHEDTWRQDCVFCHGGGDNQTGAPPRDLGALDDTVSQSFIAHSVHVEPGVSSASDCTECHDKPTDVLSPGHAFDDTPATAEVDLTGELNPSGRYDGGGGCSSLYCHGDGRGDNGAYVDGSAPLGCDGCHADQGTPDRWDGMSGEHEEHLDDGISCAECHQQVTRDGQTIARPGLHIDRLRQVDFLEGTITFDPSAVSCDGPCHDEEHEREAW